MTVPDISAEFPSFKKNLKRLKDLQKKAAYLEVNEVKKATNAVGMLKKSKNILAKVDNMEANSDMGGLNPEPPEPKAAKPPKMSEQEANIIAPKIKQIAETKRDTSFTVPSVSPEENYAADKYSRLTENYSMGVNTEITNYDKRIKELVMAQKPDWLEESTTELGRWTAAEAFKSKMQKVGLTNALEWLSDSIEKIQNGRLNPYEYLETEEAGEFNQEFRDKLNEKDFYRNGYTDSLKNLYKTFYPQLYKSFVEESDDEANDNPLIKRALMDVPDIQDEELGKQILKQAIAEQLQDKYQEKSDRLTAQINKYVDDNYGKLKLNAYRTKNEDKARQELLNKFSSSDTIQEILRLQGFRGNEVDKLSLSNINTRDLPIEINKFVAELQENRKFSTHANEAELIAARIFGDEFEKHYNQDLMISYKRSNPHYMHKVIQNVNTLIGEYNESTPGNVHKIPYIRLTGKEGEIKKKDIESINKFFAADGAILEEFMKQKRYRASYPPSIYFRKLKKMNSGGGLSFMSDKDSNAALFLNNLLTENRGKTAGELTRTKGYSSNGIAYFVDPRDKETKLYMKELLNSPVFMDPQFFGEAVELANKNPHTTNTFLKLAEEIMPLVTGAFYEGRKGKPERMMMSAEQLALEDYLSNPFVKRLNDAIKSPEKFNDFLKFFQAAMNDLGAIDDRKVHSKALFNSGMERFFMNTSDKPPLDAEALKITPIRNKTAFESTFFRAPDQHVQQMQELEALGWISKNPEIGTSVKVFAAPIYKSYFAPFLESYNTRTPNLALRQNLVEELNRKLASTIFEDNNGTPYNYFAKVHDIKDDEIKNGVLEALYILKKFDEDFYGRLLSSDVDSNGVLNPDLVPKIVTPEPAPVEPQPQPEPEQIQPEQPVMPMIEEQPVVAEAAIEEPIQEVSEDVLNRFEKEPNEDDFRSITEKQLSDIQNVANAKWADIQRTDRNKYRKMERAFNTYVDAIDDLDFGRAEKAKKILLGLGEEFNLLNEISANLAKLKGLMRVTDNKPAEPEKEEVQVERKPIRYKRKPYNSRTFNREGEVDINKPVMLKKGMKRLTMENKIGKQLKRHDNLRALLGKKADDSGGVKRQSGAAGWEIADWEDATASERGYTLFNALLALADPEKPWGLNPAKKVVNPKTGQIETQYSQKYGLDSFLPREWLDKAIKEYVHLPEDQTPLYFKESPTFKKYKMTEIDPLRADEEVKRYSSTAVAELPEEGKEGIKNRVEEHFKSKSTAGGIKGSKLYNDAVDRVWAKKQQAELPKLNMEELQKKKEHAVNILNYFKETVDESNSLDEDVKMSAMEALDNMMSAIDKNSIIKYNEAYRKFQAAIGNYDSLETETFKMLDPYREKIREEHPEDYINRFDENENLRNITNKMGQIVDKGAFFGMYERELSAIITELNDKIKEYEMTRYSNPTESEFQDIVEEMFSELDPVVKEKFEKLKDKNRPLWDKYAPILEQYYPLLKKAIKELNIEEVNKNKAMLEKIPPDIFAFHNALSGFIEPINYLSKKRAERVAGEPIAAARKEKAERRKQLEEKKKKKSVNK